MAFMDSYDPTPTARRVSGPAILILTGETDRQAEASQVADWVAAFRSSGNKDVTGRVLPGLNHLFVPDPDGFPGGYLKLPQPIRVERSVIGVVGRGTKNRRLGIRSLPSPGQGWRGNRSTGRSAAR